MKKILLALDPSPQSQRAAVTVAEVVRHLPSCEVLLAVISQCPPDLRPPLADVQLPMAGEVHGDVDALAELAEGQVLLREISLLFLQRGVAAERVRRILQPKIRGVARDLLDLAASEDCDTIVVGRRDLSKVQSLLLGSVSTAIVQNAVGRSVWVVE